MLRFLARFLLALPVCLLLGLTVLLAWLHWRPAPTWEVPLHIGNVPLHIGVTELVRAATYPAILQVASGHTFSTRFGRIRFLHEEQGLLLRCAPCTLQSPHLGHKALHFAYLDLSIHRRGNQLWGSLSSDAVTLHWQALLTDHNLTVSGTLPVTPAQQVYAVFRKNIPEMKHAEIDGSIGTTFSLSLPDHHWQVRPDIRITRVSGLGTEQLKGRPLQADCAHPAPGGFGPRIGRAIIAAEDQRFAEHLGYDPQELSAALSPTLGQLGLPRGASTLDEQLARMLFTGAGRSPIRKMRELLYAVEMDRTLGKAGILRLYLEIAPWGDKLCGAEAAARHYFHKPARALSLRESAWLASLLRAPELVTTDPERVARHALWIVRSMRHVPLRERRYAQASLESSLARLEKP